LCTTLGVDHLLNEDDKHRLRRANAEMRDYLDEITSENINDGYLNTKIANKIGEFIGDEMKQFSEKLKEKKKREAILDLANTKSLPQES
jgi:hypothetical protein